METKYTFKDGSTLVCRWDNGEIQLDEWKTINGNPVFFGEDGKAWSGMDTTKEGKEKYYTEQAKKYQQYDSSKVKDLKIGLDTMVKGRENFKQICDKIQDLTNQRKEIKGNSEQEIDKRSVLAFEEKKLRNQLKDYWMVDNKDTPSNMLASYDEAIENQRNEIKKLNRLKKVRNKNVQKAMEDIDNKEKAEWTNYWYGGKHYAGDSDENSI